MKILITGSQGFIGHQFYRYLTKLGHNVLGIDIVNNGYAQNFKKLDLRKQKLPEERFDIIFHLASDAGGIRYLNNHSDELVNNNMAIDTNVINYAKTHTQKIVYFSSSCVYDENAYGKEKFFGEKLVKSIRTDYLIVRPQNVFGIEDKKSGQREQVIMALFRQALHQEEIILLGSGKEKRNFIWVKDLFDLIMNNLKFKKQTLDAGGEWITILNLAKKILKVTKQKKQIYVHIVSQEKPKKYIKFKKQKMSINKGLKEIYKWINQ